jgi:hypothetical protein
VLPGCQPPSFQDPRNLGPRCCSSALAIIKMLTEAGYEAGMGVDMDPGAVWMRARG